MDSFDLFSMRETFNRQNIMLCFNGPISHTLIEEIGNALRNYLQADNVHPSAAMDVFAVYIEMTQNIRHYAARKGWLEHDSAVTMVIARDDAGRYVVSAGNLVDPADGASVLAQIDAMAGLDKAQLKAAYKEQLRKPRDPGATSGAGLGLLEIARKASAPLIGSLRQLADGRAFISLRAVI
jgi:hypothetical protein